MKKTSGRNLVCALLLAGVAAMTWAADVPSIADAAEQADESLVRALLKQHAEVNRPGHDGTPALHWVVDRQNLALARELIRAGADVNAPTRYGLRPLHLAIQNADAPMVRLLLKAGASAVAPDATGETPLIMAARAGDLAVVDALLAAHAPVDGRDAGFQQTPLMAAARYGYVPIVKRFIERGASVNAQTRTGETPKFRSPLDNKGSHGTGILRSGWPLRGERDPMPGAKTALLYAAREGHVEVATLLLDSGASIEQADADGVTPLLMAVLNEHLELATSLIERGAKVGAIDWFGETPLFAAVDVRDLDVPDPTHGNGVDRQAAYRLIELILSRGADPNVRTREVLPKRLWITSLGPLSWVDFTGQTPFLRAALAGDIEVMRLLVAHGADANIATDGGTTALMAAAGVNWTVSQTYDEGPAALLEAVKYAHSLGNDVNAANSMGIRAIHGAANRGLDDIIRYLVAQGASLDAADKQGRTPLVWAQGVFLATHPPQPKPTTIALLTGLANRSGAAGAAGAAE